MAMQDIHSPLPPSQIDLPAEEVVMDCLNMLAASAHLDTAIDSFLETLGFYYDAQRVFLFQTHSDTDAVSCSFAWPVSPGDTPNSCSISTFGEWVDAFDSEGSLCLYSPDDHRIEPLTTFCAQPPGSALAVPLYTGTVLSGFLCVVNPKQHLTDMKVLLAVSSMSVVELRKLQLMTRLDYLTRKDPLTDTYNRFSYVSSLARSYQSTPSSMGVVFTSVNGLKTVHAVLGLAFGNSVVQQTAEIGKTTLCTSVYRISGDEFVSLHPNLDADAFHTLVAALQGAFAAAGTCDVSIGSAWSAGDVDVHALLAQADQQVSENKKAADSAKEKSNNQDNRT